MSGQVAINFEFDWWYIFSPYCSLYICYSTDEENLLNNQEPLKLVIISFILMTPVIVLGVVLIGENSY